MSEAPAAPIRDAPIPAREREALEEVARTRVRPATATALLALFGATLALVPATQAAADLGTRLARFARGAFRAGGLVLAGSPAAGNQALREEMKALEDGLEK